MNYFKLRHLNTVGVQKLNINNKNRSYNNVIFNISVKLLVIQDIPFVKLYFSGNAINVINFFSKFSTKVRYIFLTNLIVKAKCQNRVHLHSNNFFLLRQIKYVFI